MEEKCKSGDFVDCLNSCDNCNEQTIDSLNNRDNQCMSVCGSPLKYGYSSIKSICECAPRTEINPCKDKDTACFLEQGYQYWDEVCDVDGAIGGGALQTNDNNLVACDFTYPYDNDIVSKYNTPFRGDKHDLFVSNGYLKWDKVTNNIVHIAMNARQGKDPVGSRGIMRSVSVDPEFKSKKLTNNDLKVSINTNSNLSPYSESDRHLEAQIDHKYIDIQKNNVNLVFDFYTCHYGYLRWLDVDFNKDVHKYYVFGLGPISEGDASDYSLSWSNYKRRCNMGFGTQQTFGIHGSHWPVMYILRHNTQTNEQKCFMIFFDHYRKVEYFFDDLHEHGIIKIRTREPEFKFYVAIEDTDCKKQIIQI